VQGLITDSGIRHDILEKYAGRASSKRGARSFLFVGVPGWLRVRLRGGAGTMKLQLQAKLWAVPDVPPGKVLENAQTSG